MPRAARTSLFAVAGLVGGLLGAAPAHAAPVEAEPLFEAGPTTVPMTLQPLSATAAGFVFESRTPHRLFVQPAGGEPVLDQTFWAADNEYDTWVRGNLLATWEGGTLVWRTIADPVHREHDVPDGLRSVTGTSTGYVAVRGSGPYEVVRVDLLDGGSVELVGTSTTALGSLVVSSTGVAARTQSGRHRYFPFSAPGTGRAVPTPAPYSNCPWLSRSHLFCRGTGDAVHRISLATGATSTTYGIGEPVETSTGVAFLSSAADGSGWELKTWASTAAAPTVRLGASFDLAYGITAGPGGGSVVVSRHGDLGRGGLWSVPLPSGTSTPATAARPQPRSARGVALAPGSIAWGDNSSAGGSVWTRDLTGDGSPTGEDRLVADRADPLPLSAGAGRVTYEANQLVRDQTYPLGTRLADGGAVTKIDDRASQATLSGDRLLSAHLEPGTPGEIWELRDLRTGEVTPLDSALDYDLWGERLVRLEKNGRVTLYDLRTAAAPVELRAATPSETWSGDVHVAGDRAAWAIYDGATSEHVVALRDVATMASAGPLAVPIYHLNDLSTGYVVGSYCEGTTCGKPGAISLESEAVVSETWWSAVDGNVVAAVRDGLPTLGVLPAYADAPRLLGDLDASGLAGPGRTWRARVVTSRVLTACTIEIRDGSDAVVRTLDCTNPHAAKTVTWNGRNGSGDPVPAGEYTWQLTGATGADELVDYDGSTTALTGSLSVPGAFVPTARLTPGDDARSVGQTDDVTAAFNAAVTGVSGDAFRLRAPDGSTVPAAVTYDAAAMTATLDPTASLAGDTRYTATLTGAVETATGAPLEPLSWTFTTGPEPAFTRRAPGPDARSASPSGSLTVTFSEQVTGVDADSFRLTSHSDLVRIPGVVTYDSGTRTATFDPTTELAADSRYDVIFWGDVDGARDLAGNPVFPSDWSFTTGPAPTVTGTFPAANATGASRTGNAVAAFSEPMLAATWQNVTLRTASGSAVPAEITYNASTRKVTINPTKTLAARTKYTVTLTGGTTAIRDTVGNPLATKTWSFTTGS